MKTYHKGYEFWVNRVEQELNVISKSTHFAKRLIMINSVKLEQFYDLNYSPLTAADMLFVLDLAESPGDAIAA